VKKAPKANQAEIPNIAVFNEVCQKYPETGDELVEKLIFVMGSMKLLRTDENHSLSFEIIVVNEDNESVSILWSQTKTGWADKIITRNEKDDKACVYRLFMKYYLEIPSTERSGPFFRHWSAPKNAYILWGGTKGLGYKKSAAIPRKILGIFVTSLPTDIQEEEKSGVRSKTRSSFANNKIGLNRYSGHTLKRFGGTVARSSGMTEKQFLKEGNWQSSATADRYDDFNVETAKERNNFMFTKLAGGKRPVGSDTDFEEEPEPPRKKIKLGQKSSPVIESDLDPFVAEPVNNVSPYDFTKPVWPFGQMPQVTYNHCTFYSGVLPEPSNPK